MQARQQNQLIAFLQIFGIWLVVVGHSFYGYHYIYGQETNYLFSWIYSFHMPLFMFISGYLLAYTSKQKRLTLGTIPWNKATGFLLKKAKRLLVPYLVISSLVFLPKVLLNQFAIHPVGSSLLDYIAMLVFPERNVISYFWFLPVLFLIFCASVITAKAFNLLNIKHIHPVIALAILFLPHLFCPWDYIDLFGISKAINHLIFFAAGYYFCLYDVEKSFFKHRSAIFVSTFTASIIFLFIPDLPGVNLLSAFTGIAMSISIGQIYVNRDWHFFNHSYGASYAIYLFSWFPQVASQNILYIIFPTCPWPISTILSSISGFYLPLLIYKIIIRHRHEPFWRIVATLSGQ